MRSQQLALLAAATGSAIAQEYYSYTATATASVAAAQATAKTSSPTSHVKGEVFDRIAIIWLENTDYDLAIGDRMCLPELNGNKLELNADTFCSEFGLVG